MKYLPLLFLLSCGGADYEKLPDYKFPPELKDCVVYRISGGKELYVVKCPNEQPSVSWQRSCGKNCITREHSQVVYER